jgi:predicted ATP-dependent serine protease
MGIRAVSMLTGEMVPAVDKMMRVEPTFYDRVLSAGVNHIVFDFNTSPSLKDIQEATESFAVMYGDFPHLLVVDNLRNVYSPEDDTAAQQHNTEDLKVLAAETGSAILLLHHVTGAFEDGSVIPTLAALENKIGKVPALVVTLSHGKLGDLRTSIVKNRYGPASPAGRLSTFVPWSTSNMRVG